MELLSNRTRRRTAGCVATLAAAGLSFGAVTAIGGSAGAADGTTGATGETAAKTMGAPGAPPMGGGPLGELTDDQVQCLEDEGVSVPDKPDAGEAPQPPDSSDRPDPDRMKSAAEACDIDLPEPPSGGEAGAPGPPPQGEGMPCAPPPKNADGNESGSQKNGGHKN